jgi:hypothetical protein
MKETFAVKKLKKLTTFKTPVSAWCNIINKISGRSANSTLISYED